MKNKKKRLVVGICIAAGLLMAFVLWTALVCLVDVQAIGPQESKVGFAGLNGWFHRLTGEHLALYTVTDHFSIIPFLLLLGFAALGAVQWIKRKKLWLVDADILWLGVFYIIVLLMYVLFEAVALNYRPVLIDGALEASYPSSTTMLALCVLPTAVMQLNRRISNRILRYAVLIVLIAFTAFLVIGRLISGVHWVTDIIGGALLSAGLVTAYATVCRVPLLTQKEKRERIR